MTQCPSQGCAGYCCCCQKGKWVSQKPMVASAAASFQEAQSLCGESGAASSAGPESVPGTRRHFSHPHWGGLNWLLLGLSGAPRCSGPYTRTCFLRQGSRFLGASTSLWPGRAGSSQGGGRQLPHPPLGQDGGLDGLQLWGGLGAVECGVCGCHGCLGGERREVSSRGWGVWRGVRRSAAEGQDGTLSPAVPQLAQPTVEPSVLTLDGCWSCLRHQTGDLPGQRLYSAEDGASGCNDMAVC